jgi:hypothetical protein
MHAHTFELMQRIQRLEAALYTALPFVEDHEGSPVYKPEAVTAAIKQIHQVLKEPTP